MALRSAIKQPEENAQRDPGEKDGLAMTVERTRPGSMHDTGCLGLVHWDDPEGWNGEGGGRRVQDGDQGRQGSRGCIPGSPGESGLVSRGSQGLRSPLESRRQPTRGRRSQQSEVSGSITSPPYVRCKGSKSR